MDEAGEIMKSARNVGGTGRSAMNETSHLSLRGILEEQRVKEARTARAGCNLGRVDNVRWLAMVNVHANVLALRQALLTTRQAMYAA